YGNGVKVKSRLTERTSGLPSRSEGSFEGAAGGERGSPNATSRAGDGEAGPRGLFSSAYKVADVAAWTGFHSTRYETAGPLPFRASAAKGRECSGPSGEMSKRVAVEISASAGRTSRSYSSTASASSAGRSASTARWIDLRKASTRGRSAFSPTGRDIAEIPGPGSPAAWPADRRVRSGPPE